MPSLYQVIRPDLDVNYVIIFDIWMITLNYLIIFKFGLDWF